MRSLLPCFCCGTFLTLSCPPCGADPGAVSPGPDTVLELERINLLRNASFEWDDHGTRALRDGLAADWWFWGKGYGQYNERSVPSLPSDGEMVSGLRTFIAAAHAAGAQAQIGIQQQNFPDWANDGAWDDANRYRHAPTTRLAETWTRLAHAIKDCAGLDSYLLINEENAVHDADAYLRAMSKVAAAVRAADPNPIHRITLRPNTRNPYLCTRITSSGSHDMDYGSGGYPTSSAWYLEQYADPTSPVACLRMAYLHDSTAAFDGPCGIGEIVPSGHPLPWDEQ